MTRDPQARNLRVGRIEVPGVVYFVTSTFRERGRPLEPAEVDVVLDAVLWLREQQRARVFAFVVMPDHVHALLQPVGSDVLQTVMKTWKGFTGRRINTLRGTSGELWEHGYYDRAMRSVQEVHDTLRYIHENPVEAGIVKRADEYVASSAHLRWRGRFDPL